MNSLQRNALRHGKSRFYFSGKLEKKLRGIDAVGYANKKSMRSESYIISVMDRNRLRVDRQSKNYYYLSLCPSKHFRLCRMGF